MIALPPRMTMVDRFHAVEDATWQRDRADAEDLIRAVAPELFAGDRGMPIYLLSIRQVRALAADCPVEMIEANCRAFTNDLLSISLRPALERIGMWKGVGFAAVFDAARLSTPNARLGVSLHELTHFLLSDRLLLVKDCLFGDALGEHKSWALSALAPKSPHLGGWRPERNRPWCESFTHPPSFHRIAHHVVYRARRAGWRGDFFDTTHAWGYGLDVNPICWWYALGRDDGELAALVDVPIAEIVERRPPRHFRRLAAKAIRRRNRRWRRRLARWAIDERAKAAEGERLAEGSAQ